MYCFRGWTQSISFVCLRGQESMGACTILTKLRRVYSNVFGLNGTGKASPSGHEAIFSPFFARTSRTWHRTRIDIIVHHVCGPSAMRLDIMRRAERAFWRFQRSLLELEPTELGACKTTPIGGPSPPAKITAPPLIKIANEDAG